MPRMEWVDNVVYALPQWDHYAHDGEGISTLSGADAI